MKHFKKIDFISEELGFEVNDSRIYKTNHGGVLSLIIIISIVILGIMIGNEVYERKIPNVSTSSDFLAESIVSLHEHPFFFAVGDTYGKNYENYTKYLNFFTSIINTTNDVVEFSNSLNTSVHKCTIEDFAYFKGKIEDAILDTYIKMNLSCIDFDKEAIVRDPYGSENTSFIEFSFSYCEGNSCAEDLNIVLQEIYIKFYFMDAYVDSNDYKNPIKYYFNVLNQRLSFGYLKRKFVRLLNNEFISDNGWLFENKLIYKYVTIKDTSDEINLPSPTYYTDMYWMTIESPNIRQIGKRSYMKVQDLFAKVGGIMNAILMIVNILFYDYLRFIFKKDLAHYLISSKNDNKIRNTIFSNLNIKTKISCFNKESEADISYNNNHPIINQSSIKINKRNNLISNENNLINKDNNMNISAFKNMHTNNKDIISNKELYQHQNNDNHKAHLENNNIKRDFLKKINLNSDFNMKDKKDADDSRVIKDNSIPGNNIENDSKNIQESFIYQHSNLIQDNDYIHSLNVFKLRSKEELVFYLKNISYINYIMYVIFNRNSDKNEFIKSMQTIIRHKIDFFKNIRIINED